VDLIDLQPDWQRHVVADKVEVGPPQQVRHVALLTGEEIVQADDIVPLFDQPFAKMRAEKARTTRNENAFDGSHVLVISFRRQTAYRGPPARSVWSRLLADPA